MNAQELKRHMSAAYNADLTTLGELVQLCSTLSDGAGARLFQAINGRANQDKHGRKGLTSLPGWHALCARYCVFHEGGAKTFDSRRDAIAWAAVNLEPGLPWEFRIQPHGSGWECHVRCGENGKILAREYESEYSPVTQDEINQSAIDGGAA